MCLPSLPKQVDVTSKTEGKAPHKASLLHQDARLRDNLAFDIVQEVTNTVQELETGTAPEPGVIPTGIGKVGPKAFPRVALDLATTVERIQQNFCISDPSLPDCPIGEGPRPASGLDAALGMQSVLQQPGPPTGVRPELPRPWAPHPRLRAPPPLSLPPPPPPPPPHPPQSTPLMPSLI
jgi:hypothetical protein